MIEGKFELETLFKKMLDEFIQRIEKFVDIS